MSGSEKARESRLGSILRTRALLKPVTTRRQLPDNRSLCRAPGKMRRPGADSLFSVHTPLLRPDPRLPPPWSPPVRHAPSLPELGRPEGPGTAHSDPAGYFQRRQTSLLTPRSPAALDPPPSRSPCPARARPATTERDPRGGCPLTPGSPGLQLPSPGGPGRAQVKGGADPSAGRSRPGPRSRSPSIPTLAPAWAPALAQRATPLTYLRTSVLSRLQSMVAAPGSASPAGCRR